MPDLLVLKLSPAKMDIIGNALGQRPYAEVYQLLAEMAQQLKDQQAPTAPPPADPPAQ